MKSRPGDLLMAHRAAQQMPKKFRSQYDAGIKQLPEDIRIDWQMMLT